jgi:cytochrome P450
MLCLEFISEIAFDQRLKCLNEETRSNNVTQLHLSIDEFSVYCGRLFFQAPLWKIWPNHDWKMFEKSGKFIYSQVKHYITEAYDYHLKHETKTNVKQTVLSQYLEKIDKYNLTIDDVISIMAELLIGSIDTTSATLHYLLYELSVNKSVQENLYQEIITIMSSNNSDDVTEDHLEKFKYLKWVVKENMRLNSIAPTNSRILTKDLLINNYLIPKKVSKTFMNTYFLHFIYINI